MSGLFIKHRLMNYDANRLCTEDELKRKFLNNLFGKYRFSFPGGAVNAVRSKMFAQLHKYPTYDALQYYAFKELYATSDEAYSEYTF